MATTAQLLTAATLAWLEADKSLRCGAVVQGFPGGQPPATGAGECVGQAQFCQYSSCVGRGRKGAFPPSHTELNCRRGSCSEGGGVGQACGFEGGGGNEAVHDCQPTPATATGNATVSYLGECSSIPATATAAAGLPTTQLPARLLATATNRTPTLQQKCAAQSHATHTLADSSGVPMH